MKNYYTTLFALLCSISLFAQWEQVGNAVEGDNNFDELGSALAINSDGTRYVAAASLDLMSSTKIPYVKIFDFMNNDWQLVGSAIEESNNNGGDAFDLSVDISGDGQRVIIGNDRHANNVNGRARLFENQNGSWVQLGNDILGTDFGELGDDVAISRNANRIIIGERKFDNSQGRVQVYEFDGSNLIQIGQDIVGFGTNAFFGAAVDIDDIGAIVSVVSLNDSNGFL